MSRKRLLIDSFLQHAAAAMGLPSVICWIANIPQQFSYPLHFHIASNAPTLQPDLRLAQYSPYNIGGEPIESPYLKQEDIFDADRIIESVRNFNNPFTVASLPAIPAEAFAQIPSTAVIQESVLPNQLGEEQIITNVITDIPGNPSPAIPQTETAGRMVAR